MVKIREIRGKELEKIKEIMKPKGYHVTPVYYTHKRKVYAVMSVPFFSYDHAIVLREEPDPPVCFKCRQKRCNHVKAVLCYERGLGASQWWFPEIAKDLDVMN